MSTISKIEIPTDEIKRIFENDNNPSHESATFSPNREVLLRWLRLALLDFDSLQNHLKLLQNYYKTTFLFPRPRRDCWSYDQLQQSPPATGFRYNQKLPDSRIESIMAQGIEVLDDQELSALILNPVALYDLFDALDETSPERWMDELSQLCHDRESILHSSGNTTRESAAQHNKDHQVPAFSGSTANSSDELLNRVKNPNSNIVTHSNDSHQPTVEVAKTKEQTYLTRMLAVSSLAACAASVVAVWLSLNNNDMDKLIASLPKPSVQNSNTPNTVNGMKLTSQGSGVYDLQELSRLGLLPSNIEPAEAIEALETIDNIAAPSLKKLIESRKGNQELTPKKATEILVFLRKLSERAKE